MGILPFKPLAAAAVFLLAATGSSGPQAKPAERPVATALPAGSPAAVHGRLRVCGNRLCNRQGRPIQLRGMSTHGLQWYPQCANRRSFNALAKDWKADVVRLAMYVQEGGYETDPPGFTRQVNRLVDMATSLGLYVIIDWHILDPGDPMVNLAAAKQFFARVARRHRDKTNVIYEVANEPNGASVTWNRIKRYHQQIIPVIRRQSPHSVILLGTREWSSLGVSAGSDEGEIVRNPVRARNVMYTFHFYAASHRMNYLRVLARAANRIPVFVSEFGTQTYSGDGANDFRMAQRYLDVMARNKIGWVNYNYSDDFRSGAVFEPGTCPDGRFVGNSRLKEAGRWIRARMRTP